MKAAWFAQIPLCALMIAACDDAVSSLTPDAAADLDAEAPDSGSDAELPDQGRPLADAGFSFVTCKGTFVGKVSGQILDTNGEVPSARRFTVCGNACLLGELDDDGRFEMDAQFCFDSQPPLYRPIFIYHGIAQYSDLHVDFVPAGTTRLPAYEFAQTLRVLPASLMTEARPGEDGFIIADGEGFEVRADVGATELPLGWESAQVGAMGADFWPPNTQGEDLIALYATGVEGTRFDPPASVRFPNETGLPAGTPVEIVAIGDVGLGAPYAGTVGGVARGTVSLDGGFVVTDDDSGISALTWLGYRLLPEESEP